MPSSKENSSANSVQQQIPQQSALQKLKEIRRQIRSGATTQQLVKELRRQQTRQDAIAALAYAVWQIEGEIVAERNGDDTIPSHHILQHQVQIVDKTLTILNRINQVGRERELAKVPPAHSAPNHLSSMVMQHLGGLPFQQDLRRLLQEDGLAPDAVHPPDNAGYQWARGATLLAEPDRKVQQFLDGSDEKFIAAMLEDARRPGFLPDHPLIVERRLTLDSAAMQQARYRNGKAEQEVSKLLRHQRKARHFKPLLYSYEQAGMLAIRQKQAESILAESRLTIKRLTRSPEFMRLRANYLQKAADLTAKRDPSLWQQVLSLVVVHQQHCTQVKANFPCAGCAPELAKSIKEGRTQTVPQPPAPPDPQATTPGDLTNKTLSLESTPSFEEPAHPPPLLRDNALLVTVGASVSSRSSTTGLAWVTEDGDIGVATDHASNPSEARTLAICRAVADLKSTNLPLDIIVADDRAADRARQLLRQQKGEPLAVSTSLPSVRALLGYLVGQHGHVRVLSGSLVEDHSELVEAASELAKVALASVRGGRDENDLQRKINTTAARFGVHEPVYLTSPLAKAEEPKVIQAGRELRWKHTLRGTNLEKANFPLPHKVRTTLDTPGFNPRLPLTLYHKSPACPGDKASFQLRFADEGEELLLDSSHWPDDFFPGIQIECTLRADKRSFTAKTMRLGTPLHINDRPIGYAYDPRVLTRDSAPGGLKDQHPQGMSVANWVLRTMQVLGYLDADGRAVLAEEALERNMVELGFPAAQLHQVTRTVIQLLRERRLERVKGSIGPGGYPIYPAIRHRPAVDLLSFEQKTIEVSREEHRQKFKSFSQRPQQVSGFVRRLPLGQSASDDALQAHAEAQRQAQVANDGPLKPGYTFVRKHRRNHH